MEYAHAHVGQTLKMCFITEQYNKIIEKTVCQNQM
jgi:hypothetical protein